MNQQEKNELMAMCPHCNQQESEQGTRRLRCDQFGREIDADGKPIESEDVEVEIEVAEGTGPSYITIDGVRFEIPSQLAMRLVDGNHESFRLTRIQGGDK